MANTTTCAASRAIRLSASFQRNQSGNIALFFGICLVPLAGCLGGAVDFLQAHRARTTLQSAVDAAALAAAPARNVSDIQRQQLALDTFAANTASNAVIAAATPNVSIVSGSTSVTVHYGVPTAFLKITGMSTISVEASAKVSFTGKKIELAMMTDITGSMADTRNGVAKIDGLKEAANDLLDIILPDNGPPDAARASLVPFANYVNAGNHASNVTGLSPTTTVSGVTQTLITCVSERTGPDAYTDAAPSSGSWIGGSAQGSSGSNYSADGACYRSGGDSSSLLPEIVPLTSDKPALRSQISSFTPGGSTAGHLGTAWAWYTISPSWNTIWSLSTPPAAYNDPNYMKVVVLLTDGEYNTQYSSADSKTQALAVCNSMKAAGVTVYTVGFGFDPASSSDDIARNTLTQCASGTGYYFFPYDGAALRQTFSAIGQQVTGLAGKVHLSQ